MEDVDFFGKALAAAQAVGRASDDRRLRTGYSSLSYLKRFPVDAVKVDRAFVDGLGTDPHDSALVAAIVAMAAALDLEVTAEGVETQDQLAHLKRLGCRRCRAFTWPGQCPSGARSPSSVADSGAGRSTEFTALPARRSP
jgi:EAL domain-containing protein (putative c-di-GMP-specific phosphodiesterase class I)